MRSALALAAGLFLVTAGGSPAAADPIIFDNGSFLTDAGGDYVSDVDFGATGVQFADDFILGVPSFVTGVIWWGVYFPGGTPGTDDFTIEIYDNVGGFPALLPLVAFSIGTANRTDTGVDQGDGDDIYTFHADIAATLLAAGTYWLSIYNDTTLDGDDNWYWSRSSLTGNDRHRFGLSGPWDDDLPGEQAFQLEGEPVPEPGTLLLLGAGAIAWPLVRRRRS